MHSLVALWRFWWHVVSFHPWPWKCSLPRGSLTGLLSSMMDTFFLEALSNISGSYPPLTLYGHWCWCRAYGRFHSRLYHCNGDCFDAAFHLFDAPRTRACNHDFGFGWWSFWRPYVWHPNRHSGNTHLQLPPPLTGFRWRAMVNLALRLASAFGHHFVAALSRRFCLVLFAPQLGAMVGLEFQPWDFFMLVMFALTVTASLAGEHLVKGLIAGAAGLFIRTRWRG